MRGQRFVEVSKSFYVDVDFEDGFRQLGLTSVDSVFRFTGGSELVKDNLARFRSRVQLEVNSPPRTVFLKRYDGPSIAAQLRNWLVHHKRISFGLSDVEPAAKLTEAGIKTAKTVCYGEQWGAFFEKRSFVISEKIAAAESIERKLPDCFNEPAAGNNPELRRAFIAKLARFVRKFHETKYRHRDLYFSHIFYDDDGKFYLIDLTRCFKPAVFGGRFRVKDIAQLYYSAPGRYFSRTDRLRFYRIYTGCNNLTGKDKAFIRRVKSKAKRMARHDKKRGREAPFEN